MFPQRSKSQSKRRKAKWTFSSVLKHFLLGVFVGLLPILLLFIGAILYNAQGCDGQFTAKDPCYLAGLDWSWMRSFFEFSWIWIATGVLVGFCICMRALIGGVAATVYEWRRSKTDNQT